MWRGSAFLLACGWALLCVCWGPARADDTALIDPSTTIVTVDGVKLSAGLILVPAGKDLEKWWAGEGHDSATQERVRKELDTHSEAAVDTELLRAALSNARDKTNDATKEEFQPTVEKFMPRALTELRKVQKIDDWSPKSPRADPYINAWLASHADAMLGSELAALAWLESPDRADAVRTHWTSHREDYLVLRSARWRQITVTGTTISEVEDLLNAGEEFATVAEKFSQDSYRTKGGLLESEAPHFLIPADVIRGLEVAQPGRIVRVDLGKKVILLKPETTDLIPGELYEVTRRVKVDMARLKSGELAKVIAAKRRAKCRIEWAKSISN